MSVLKAAKPARFFLLLLLGETGLCRCILFLTVIILLGVGTCFPFSITVTVAAYFILKRDYFEYVWRFNHPFKKTEIKMMGPE